MSAELRRQPIRYEDVGAAYGRTRQPDPRIARPIRTALGDARTVVNVGAGLGWYEPADLEVTAVEPAAAMIAARPPGASPCVRATAQALPFADDSFDAAMAVLTMQHWPDVPAGLRELARVARRRIVLFTWDPGVTDHLWLTNDYITTLRDRDWAIFPTMQTIAAALAPWRVAVETVPVPHDCADGFLGAYWRRPRGLSRPRRAAGHLELYRARRRDARSAPGAPRRRPRERRVAAPLRAPARARRNGPGLPHRDGLAKRVGAGECRRTSEGNDLTNERRQASARKVAPGKRPTSSRRSGSSAAA